MIRSMRPVMSLFHVRAVRDVTTPLFEKDITHEGTDFALHFLGETKAMFYA